TGCRGTRTIGRSATTSTSSTVSGCASGEWWKCAMQRTSATVACPDCCTRAQKKLVGIRRGRRRCEAGASDLLQELIRRRSAQDTQARQYERALIRARPAGDDGGGAD